jgi:hypothetical protein
MSLAENIYHHSRKLPEQAAREALDFIQFLGLRYAGKVAARPGDTEAFLAAVAGTLGDDFPDDIMDDDLGLGTHHQELDCGSA